jgi:hypothetical protein
MHRNSLRLATAGLTAIVLAIMLMVPLAARGQGGTSAPPTRQNPIRFTAFNVSMNAGFAGTTEITIERWSTPAERQSLLALVKTAKEGQPGQRALLEALQKIEPRVGSLATQKSLGWDLRYAYEFKLGDGTRQIVIATDKPVTFAAATTSGRIMDYPFTVIEIRMKPNAKGEGRMLSATSIVVKDGRLELENYGQEPVSLTNITEERIKR